MFERIFGIGYTTLRREMVLSIHKHIPGKDESLKSQFFTYVMEILILKNGKITNHIRNNLVGYVRV